MAFGISYLVGGKLVSIVKVGVNSRNYAGVENIIPGHQNGDFPVDALRRIAYAVGGSILRLGGIEAAGLQLGHHFDFRDPQGMIDQQIVGQIHRMLIPVGAAARSSIGGLAG